MISLLRGPSTTLIVLAISFGGLFGCQTSRVPKGHGPAQYVCGPEPVIVTATSIDRELLYVCDDDDKKITWNFDKTKVSGVSIEFKPDYPFRGPANPIVSKPQDDYVVSPTIPKKPNLMLYKYFITITSASGQTTTLDPHILSGGSY
jgi:hypothetical protein